MSRIKIWITHKNYFYCKGQPGKTCECDNVKIWNLDTVPELP